MKKLHGEGEIFEKKCYFFDGMMIRSADWLVW